MTDFLVKKFVPNYTSTDSVDVRTAYGRLSGIVGIICNVIMFVFKLAAGFISGSISITDPSEVDRNLGYPAAQGDQLESAASLTHMLNANTFTAGAYQIKDGADMDALAKELEKNIQSRQWICGFPDRLLVAYVGNCLVGVFGADDLVQTFQDQLSAIFADVVIVSTAAIN